MSDIIGGLDIVDNPALGIFFGTTKEPDMTKQKGDSVYDVIRLESFPLHTEKPEWAKHAPAQVEALCKRNPHFGGFTETRGPIMTECKRIADQHGYNWFQAPMDAHRNVSIIVRKSIKVLRHNFVAVFNNYRGAVTVDWYGRELTVYEMHWEPTDNGHIVQTNSLVEAMKETSKGTGISFYMGDSNPSKPQRVNGSQPDTLLSQLNAPVIYEELKRYPVGIGVNVIGRMSRDTSISPVDVFTHAALGSDHIPVTAIYKIRRPKK